MTRTNIKLVGGERVTVNAAPAEVATALSQAHAAGEPFALFPCGSHDAPTWVAVGHVIEFSEQLVASGLAA